MNKRFEVRHPEKIKNQSLPMTKKPHWIKVKAPLSEGYKETKKLVKQNNTIVKFLSQIEIEDITDDFEDIGVPTLSEEEKNRSKKLIELKALVNEFMDKQQDLKEFEEELKKHKDKLTPGQVGES